MYSLYAFIYDVFFVVDDEKHYLPKNTSVKTVCPRLLRRIHRSPMYSSYGFVYDVFFVLGDIKHYLPKNTSVKTVYYEEYDVFFVYDGYIVDIR